LTLCKTFQQHIHVTSKSTHPSFPVHKFRWACQEIMQTLG
jgi:hypothetical protein